MLIEIEDKIFTDELLSQRFICNIEQCKGACCVEGDDGAPLLEEEIQIIEQLLPKIKPFMTKEGLDKIEKEGISHLDDSGNPVTNLVEDGACIFVSYTKNGTAKCSIEQAYRNKETDFKKPISCELFPVRAEKIKQHIALNYQELAICNSACVLGEKLGIPLYQFLKEPLIRAYGADFYKELEKVTLVLQHQNKKGK